jgi:uncharacterized membrane protein YjfL (UPF0719 family)
MPRGNDIGKNPGERRESVFDFGHEVRVFLVAVIYAFAGMALLMIGYKIFDMLTPTDMQEKIFKEGNIAVAVALGFFLLGIAIVIHAAFSI